MFTKRLHILAAAGLFKYVLPFSEYEPQKGQVKALKMLYNLCNLKNVKNSHDGVLLLVKFQAKAKSNTPS